MLVGGDNDKEEGLVMFFRARVPEEAGSESDSDEESLVNQVADLLAERIYIRLCNDLQDDHLTFLAREEGSIVDGGGGPDKFEFTCDLK